MALTVACRACSFMSIVKSKYFYAVASIHSFYTAPKRADVRSNTEANSASLNADVQFTVFYRFPYIVPARFISRLKLYQTAVVILSVPPTLYGYKIGALSLEASTGVIGMSTLAMIMLYIATNFFQRIVGLLALSSDEKLVRMSHMTFFGNRNDVVIPIEDIVPISDMNERCNDIFVRVRRYSRADMYYMTMLYGQIENVETFHKVFGVTR